MIERKFVKTNLRSYLLEEFVGETLKNVGLSHVTMTRTPLGEKILIHASRPGLVVGRKGENIKKLTMTLKKKFDLENPKQASDERLGIQAGLQAALNAYKNIRRQEPSFAVPALDIAETSMKNGEVNLFIGEALAKAKQDRITAK